MADDNSAKPLPDLDLEGFRRGRALRDLRRLVTAIFGEIPTDKLSALLQAIIDGADLPYRDMPKALVLAIEDAKARIRGKRCNELREAARRLRERQLAAEDEAAVIAAALLLIVQPQGVQFVFPPPAGSGAWLTDLTPLAALALLRDIVEVSDDLITFMPPPARADVVINDLLGDLADRTEVPPPPKKSGGGDGDPSP